MKLLLRFGVAGAFVLVAVGATFDALAVTAVLYLLDRTTQVDSAGQHQETGA